jgi:Mrp family chromosome partitioning ATPase
LDEAIIHTAQLPNLYILPCGKHKGNASELLDSPLWRQTCESLRNRFDYVVLDSPPVAAVADYDLLQQTSDGVLIVARPDHSSRKLFLSALKSMPKPKLLGVIVNCTQHWLFAKRDHYESVY